MKLLAKDMVSGRWYRTERTGRFVCKGKSKLGYVLVALDGDEDMQSMEYLSPDEEVETAEPKK